MKNELRSRLSRRQFLSWVSSTAGILVAHRLSANPVMDTGGMEVVSHRILSLELLTSAPLANMKEFYHRSLGMTILEEQTNRLILAGGKTRLTFVSAEGNPFYHFAFNIPQNKLLAALAWQKERGPLMPVPPRLRDPAFPNDVVHFSHWNAHSVFFYDPGGNVVEYIARHDMENDAPGPFVSNDILYASEIGIIVDDVRATATKLKEVAGVGQYKGGDEQFTAIGDELGLLLLMKRGRHLNFQSDSSKAARVFRTVGSIQGPQRAKFSLPSFPYEISVEA